MIETILSSWPRMRVLCVFMVVCFTFLKLTE